MVCDVHRSLKICCALYTPLVTGLCMDIIGWVEASILNQTTIGGLEKFQFATNLLKTNELVKNLGISNRQVMQVGKFIQYKFT